MGVQIVRWESTPSAIDSIQQPGRRGFAHTLTSSKVCNSFCSAEFPL